MSKLTHNVSSRAGFTIVKADVTFTIVALVSRQYYGTSKNGAVRLALVLATLAGTP